MEAELRRLHDQVLDLRVQVSRLEVINARQARALEESAGGSAEDAPAIPKVPSAASDNRARACATESTRAGTAAWWRNTALRMRPFLFPFLLIVLATLCFSTASSWVNSWV